VGLVSTTEVLLERKRSGSGIEIDNTAVGIRHADHVAQQFECGEDVSAKAWSTLREV
jgi:hypothetical protein